MTKLSIKSILSSPKGGYMDDGWSDLLKERANWLDHFMTRLAQLQEQQLDRQKRINEIAQMADRLDNTEKPAKIRKP